MANINATNAAAKAATPPSRLSTTVAHGRIRYFESTYDQAVHGTAAASDTITWGDLPVGAKVLPHLSQLSWGTGTASSTATVGDAASGNRHLAATAITTAGTADLTSSGGAPGYVITEATKTLTSTIAGASTASAQKITLRVAYVLD